MNETLSCFLAPGNCISDGINAIIALFPFGIEGLKAVVWMIVGAALGRWGVGALIVLALALKLSGKSPDTHEHVAGKDAAPPVKKKPKTLF